MNGDDIFRPYQTPQSPFAPGYEPLPPLIPARPRRPRVWTVFVVFLLSQVLHLGAAVAIVAAVAYHRHPELMHPRDETARQQAAEAIENMWISPEILLPTLLASQVLFSLVAIAAAVCSPAGLLDRLRLRSPRISLRAGAVAVCGVLAMNLMFVAMGGLGWIPESELLSKFAGSIQSLSGPMMVAAVLIVGVGPGIGEELLFRGYIETRFSQRWGMVWGCVWTALLFGAMHFDLVQGAFAACMGLYLGYLTERTGSIWPAMLCHAVNNTWATLSVFLGMELVTFRENLVALVDGAFVLLVCVVLFLALTRKKWR